MTNKKARNGRIQPRRSNRVSRRILKTHRQLLRKSKTMKTSQQGLKQLDQAILTMKLQKQEMQVEVL